MAQGGDANLIGRTIAGKYLIDAFLGGGAMGAVYRAHQAALDKVVAIKVMHQEHAKDGMFAARFQREAKAASRLDHPNAMRVFDFGAEPDGLLYIAMEFLDGRDLFRVIVDDWPMPPARVAGILAQALAALAVAHDMGVVHRDLKPENIMILRGTDDEGRAADIVKVCDFGIAKISDPRSDPAEKAERGTAKLTGQGLVIGTPEYMSPEQGRGESLDARSDLYSMAVILYQLITGRVPFDAESALGIVLKHVTEEPVPPVQVHPGVDPGLAAICLKGLRKKREERYQTARDMRAALKAAAPSEVLSGGVPTAPPRLHQAVTGIEGAPTMEAPATDPTLAPKAATPPPADETRGVTSPVLVSMRGAETAELAAMAERELPARRTSRAPAVIALAVVAAIGVGGMAMMKRGGASTQTSTPTPTTVTAASTESPKVAPRGEATAMTPPSAAPPPRTSDTLQPTSAAVVAASPPKRHGNEARNGRPPATNAVANAPAAAPEEEPPQTPPPPAPVAVVPAPTVAAPPPAPVLATPPMAAAPTAPPFNPELGHVHIERLTTTNGLSAARLRTALTRAHGAWATCYRTALKTRGSSAGGDATLHLGIDDTGRVTASTLNGASFLPGLDACVEASVRNLQIPGVDTGEATADVTLTFKSE